MVKKRNVKERQLKGRLEKLASQEGNSPTWWKTLTKTAGQCVASVIRWFSLAQMHANREHRRHLSNLWVFTVVLKIAMDQVRVDQNILRQIIEHCKRRQKKTIKSSNS